MAGFNAGIGVFSSCNKADSIEHFTAQLQKDPNHYNSLIWRGRAYGILGKRTESIEDYERAFLTSMDPRKSLAKVQLEHAKGNFPASKEVLENTIRRYPVCAEAYFLKGERHSGNKSEEMENYDRSIQEAKSQGLQNEPWYPWANYLMGDFHRDMINTNEAFRYYKEALDYCETLTVAHLGISPCWFIMNNEEKAKQHYTRARELNPTIVEWTTYEDFKQDYIMPINQANKRHKEITKNIGHLSLNAKGNGEIHGRKGRRSGGNDSGGSDDDDDDDDDDKWKTVKKNSPCHAEYKGKIFVQSKDGGEWYVRDKADHAGAYLKRYKDSGNSLEFKGSLDRNMQPIPGKHESAKVPIIKKNDLNIRRGHIK